MTAVEVLINRVANVGGVERTGQVVTQSQTMDDLSETVQVISLVLMSDQFNELVLIYEFRACCGEENIAGAVPCHVEAKASVLRMVPRERQVTGRHLSVFL